MTSPGGIAYDPAKVLDRAYAQIGDLTFQRDQLFVAVEAQSLEMAKLRDRISDLDRARTAPAPQTQTIATAGLIPDQQPAPPAAS